jgi:hypothetical protein
MEKRRCQAFVESKGERCQKKIRWGRKYCWWHYPKGGLILGAFLGLILALLFTEPLRRTLSPHWPFHYLDGNAPTVVGITPNIGERDYVDAGTDAFRVVCRDDCSGMEPARCDVSVYRLIDNRREHLAGRLSVGANELNLSLDEGLQYGEYVLSISLRDRARRMCESEYNFAVLERQVVDISVWYEEYDDSKHKTQFRSFIDSHEDLLRDHKLYVYQYGVYNKADLTYCRSLHLHISNQASIFCWEQKGGFKCDDVTSANVSESMQKDVAGHVFTSEWLLSIGEMAPHGFAHFSALAGFHRLDNTGVPREIGAFGTYVSEGYGKTMVEDIKRWIPIKKLQNSN